MRMWNDFCIFQGQWIEDHILLAKMITTLPIYSRKVDLWDPIRCSDIIHPEAFFTYQHNNFEGKKPIYTARQVCVPH